MRLSFITICNLLFLEIIDFGDSFAIIIPTMVWKKKKTLSWWKGKKKYSKVHDKLRFPLKVYQAKLNFCLFIRPIIYVTKYTNGLSSCADIVNEIMKTRLSYNIWRGLIDILNFDCISIRSLMMICLGIIMKCLSWIVWPSKIVARTLCCRCVFPMHDICRGIELLELRSWPCHFYREECRLQIKWQQRARASGY